ncbi:MAG: indolepyruvate ferredoxin oxidoreductase subunit alpha [Candidatus Adiutrix sp.]|jgi:indolepyruvate ferredoxin oxidoreductase alpha subunit|nr:indolepyruvate ferredoxin oxidoreductase subunit alpha [Candidatus Adiutrix sp.]
MKKLLTGNEAIALGAIEAGVVYAGAYPGTPSTEILEILGSHPRSEIIAEWAPNEKVALESAIGASVAGGRALAAMKHVGVNAAADPLLSFAYSGSNGGLVLVSADDPGLHSSQNEQDNRHYARLAKLPMMEPADSQEAKDMVRAALELSEKYQRPVLLRTTTRINHSKSVVDSGEKIRPPKRPYERQPRFNLVPAVSKQLHVDLEARMLELAAHSEESPLNFIEWHDRKIGVVAAGAAYQYAREVFGEKASYCKIGFSYPLPLKKIRGFAEQVETLYVIEELDPFMEEQIKAAGIKCLGKDLIPICDELAPSVVAKALLGVEPEMVKLEVQAAPRPPTLCAGCPHRGFFYQAGKLKDVVLTSDIGCYGLGGSPPLNAKDTCICMGAASSLGHGAQKTFDFFGEKKRVVANMGDSTFFHTGLLGLMQTVYNNSPVVTCILDNRTTGMTGHQENPGSGFTLQGDQAPVLEIEPLVRALGVRHVKVVNPLDQKAMKEALEWALAITDAPSVIITRWPCVLKRLSRADREEFGDYFHRCEVDTPACVGCRTCVRTGCPALRFDKAAKKTRIEPSQCVGCEICLQVCPKSAIRAVKKGGN